MILFVFVLITEAGGRAQQSMQTARRLLLRKSMRFTDLNNLDFGYSKIEYNEIHAQKIHHFGLGYCMNEIVEDESRLMIFLKVEFYQYFFGNTHTTHT